ncbi:hypothetical protein BB561_001518 [Smittium simulii]|uniref:Methyltransferase domain-containing protein n=1 Tax=Smittium simulii TaxID=133385 RepID=A0A2T9YU54_9FUNG|nr:hypothetical protein BB561_001518 [Smittium simulii]
MRDTDLSKLPSSNIEYATKQYWDERYSSGGKEIIFDWFKRYSDIKELINSVIPEKTLSILMLGCGNSSLSEDMYNDGYQDITNIDFSEIVIQQMSERCSELDMKWQVMDVLDLKYPDNQFDVLIDKGTMDALMCEKGDVWDPSDELKATVKKEVDCAERVLKPGGVFLYITFGQPHFRKRFLIRDSWDIEVKTLGQPHFRKRFLIRDSWDIEDATKLGQIDLCELCSTKSYCSPDYRFNNSQIEMIVPHFFSNSKSLFSIGRHGMWLYPANSGVSSDSNQETYRQKTYELKKNLDKNIQEKSAPSTSDSNNLQKRTNGKKLAKRGDKNTLMRRLQNRHNAKKLAKRANANKKLARRANANKKLAKRSNSNKKLVKRANPNKKLDIKNQNLQEVSSTKQKTQSPASNVDSKAAKTSTKSSGGASDAEKEKKYIKNFKRSVRKANISPKYNKRHLDKTLMPEQNMDTEAGLPVDEMAQPLAQEGAEPLEDNLQVSLDNTPAENISEIETVSPSLPNIPGNNPTAILQKLQEILDKMSEISEDLKK